MMESIPTDKNTPVLVVDDEKGLLLSIKTILLSSGLPEPALLSDSRRVMDVVRANNFRLVLLDLMMPHKSGLEVLQELKEQFPEIECIIITAVDDVTSAVQAMKFGAYDYLVKPIQSEKLVILINRALERFSLRQGLSILARPQSFSTLNNPAVFAEMVAQDEAMALVFHQVEALAPTDYTVMITGETGTGKEMLARCIHDSSSRKHRPFIAVNMASFSSTLFEDDFFGHEKGSYTGAVNRKDGFFETARGGTLFLDEIVELAPELQAKLLRVLQENELYRLGSTSASQVDVRIIAATNCDILALIEAGRFRADLYYRLNMGHIHLPPLRERKKDILPLARHFLQHYCRQNKKDIKRLSPDLAQRLGSLDFPGNVRELQNIIAAAVVMEHSEVLTLASTRLAQPGSQQPAAPIPNDAPLLPLAEIEKQHILRVLAASQGNRTQAAKKLGIGLRTLQRKLQSSPEDD